MTGRRVRVPNGEEFDLCSAHAQCLSVLVEFAYFGGSQQGHCEGCASGLEPLEYARRVALDLATRPKGWIRQTGPVFRADELQHERTL